MNKKGRYELLPLKQRQEIFDILNSIEETGTKPNYSALARRFNVSARTISRMRESKENWLSRLKRAEAFPSYSNRKKLPLITTLEDELYQWFSDKKKAKVKLSGSEFREKALLLNKELKGNPNFKASEGWLTRFKIRYDIGQRRPHKKFRPASNTEICNAYVSQLGYIIEDKSLRPNQIYNVDQTSLIWRSIPGNSLEAHFESDYFDQSKEHVTIITCFNASGTHKVPLLVIGDSRKIESLENKQLPITYVYSENCEVTTDIFMDWYTKIFLPSVKKHQTERNHLCKVLLLMNNLYCVSKEDIDSIDVTSAVEFLPFGANSMIEPMKQGIVEKMKKLYRQSFLRELLLEETVEGVLEFIRQRNMNTFSIQIASAWMEITPSDIKGAWEKLIPSGESGKSTWNPNSDIDFTEILYRIPGLDSCTLDDVVDWFQSDGRYIESLEDPLKIIKTDVKSEEESYSKNSDDHIDPKTRSRIEAQEAYETFKKYRRWLESRSECKSQHLMALQELSELTKDIVSCINFGEYCV